jgi:pyrroloquinoline quinone biosynthesis protein D
MTAAEAITDKSRPKLANFVRVEFDKTRERWILQGPERVMVLDETGKEILDRATGAVTVNEIAARLAQEYDAPADVIQHDVLAVLRLLAEKNFLEIADDQS